MKKLLLTLLAIVATTLATFAEESSVTFGNLGYQNAEDISNVVFNEFITLNCDKGTSNNPPKYYTTGTGIRFYNGNNVEFVASKGALISKIEFTASGTSYLLKGSANVSSLVPSGSVTTWTNEVAIDKVVITPNNTSRIQVIKVTYIVPSGKKVTMSFPQSTYRTDLNSGFEAPQLICDPEEARSSVVFKSSDKSVATVDSATGVVTLIKNGITTITAEIPADNEDYYGDPAEYDLEIFDVDAEVRIINKDFFEGATNKYAVYTGLSDKTGYEYTSVFYVESGSMQLNNGSKRSGCGIVVSKLGSEYDIKSIQIDFVDEKAGKGLFVYTKNTAFEKPAVDTPINVDGAELINAIPLTDDSELFINAPSFAIVPAGEGVVQIKSISVTYYLLNNEDGSKRFTSESFTNYFMFKEEKLELKLEADAPTVRLKSLDESIATVDGLTITAKNPGSAALVAEWDAVPGKWMAGSTGLNVYVKYENLASVLNNVKEGELYMGNFPVILVSDNGKYNYVTDENQTAWALFFIDHDHEDGSVLPAGWSGVYTDKNGIPEFTNIKHEEIEDKVTVNLKEYSFNDIDESNINQVFVLKTVKFDDATPSDQSDFNGEYNGKSYSFYNQFSKESVAAGVYNIKAVVANDPDAGLQIYPIEYYASTPMPKLVEKAYKTGDPIEFTGREEGARILYRHGGQDPDHTNVFTGELNPANAPRKVANANPAHTYNHETHPMTFEPGAIVKFVAHVEGKEPSAVQYYAFNTDGTITGTDDLEVVDNEGEAVYYNLQGVRVNGDSTRLPAGLYIRVASGKATKVLVK